MKKIAMRGAVAPIITVFGVDESIDEKRTLEHVDFMIRNEVGGIVVCGSTGESVAMSLDERKRLTEIVAQHVSGRVPVFVGTGTYRTRDAVELSRHAKAVGGDGLLVIAPYYMQPTTAQVTDHFRTIANAVELPIILYDNPSVTGFSLTPDQMASLVKQDLISGVKLTGGDSTYVHELRYLCKDAITIFYGADSAPLQALLAGADGWISGVVNLIPLMSSRLCQIAMSGDAKGACELYQSILPLMRFQLLTSPDRDPHWLSFLKTGLLLRGRDVGKPRLPLSPLNKEYENRLAPLMSDLLEKNLERR